MIFYSCVSVILNYDLITVRLDEIPWKWYQQMPKTVTVWICVWLFHTLLCTKSG